MTHFIGIGEVTFIQEEFDENSEIQIELTNVLEKYENVALELKQNNKYTLEQTIIKPYVKKRDLESCLLEG